MIITKTKLKKIPEKCSKCKFCYEPGGSGAVFDKHMIAYRYRLKRCFQLNGGTING